MIVYSLFMSRANGFFVQTYFYKKLDSLKSEDWTCESKIANFKRWIEKVSEICLFYFFLIIAS